MKGLKSLRPISRTRDVVLEGTIETTNSQIAKFVERMIEDLEEDPGHLLSRLGRSHLSRQRVRPARYCHRHRGALDAFPHPRVDEHGAWRLVAALGALDGDSTALPPVPPANDRRHPAPTRADGIRQEGNAPIGAQPPQNGARDPLRSAALPLLLHPPPP